MVFCICLFCCCLPTVPSVPRDLQLTLTPDDPPVVTLRWQPPRHTHGALEGYRLTYSIAGGIEGFEVEEKQFDADKLGHTTGFLG